MYSALTRAKPRYEVLSSFKSQHPVPVIGSSPAAIPVDKELASYGSLACVVQQMEEGSGTTEHGRGA